jgi:predicted Co/Zn/Cd cation transporter (cation efflux family)
MDVEAQAVTGAATSKNFRQSTRDTLLLCVAAGIAFGVFWYGVIALMDSLWDRETEVRFGVAAAVGVIVCAVCH